MTPRIRAALLACAFAGAALAGAAAADAAAPRQSGSLVGTYQRMNKDLVEPGGHLRDVYRDVLVTGERAYTLHLPKGHRLKGGTTVRVSGLRNGGEVTAQEVETLAPPAAVATTGTTKVLVILAYWTSPDSVTTAQAKTQFFADDHGWFQEASYKQLGLTGTATPWVRITGPTGGQCYTNHMEIMSRAKAAAKALGSTYDSVSYNRTVVYFPRCSGSDSAGAAGWAYEPGTEVWLNGYMDRRVSVHEQGHNYGLEHAHTYHCTVSGKTVTLGTTSQCFQNEYGDDYDAMGGGPYTGHFSAAMKNQLGWLGGRKKTLTATETTFTLAPFEKVTTTPVAAVAGTSTPSRTYWMEYRQRIGYDGALPPGATDGVLVHMVDTAITPGPFLLDPTPHDPYEHAVIPPGGAWTSPEGVRIAVGAATSNGVTVTVRGNAPPPTAPSAPTNLTATGGDGSVRLTWSPPASNGGATVQGYVVTRNGVTVGSLVTGTSYEVGSLQNGTQYAFTVAARNLAGTGPSVAAAATPAVQLPSVTLTAPGDGAVVSDDVTLAAAPLPHPASQAQIEYVEFAVDGEPVAQAYQAPWTATWDSSWVDDGTYTVTATAYDVNYRYATSAPVTVTVKAPRPAVTLTAPTDGTTITADETALTASVTPAPGTQVDHVAFEVVDGGSIGYAYEAPWTVTWDTSQASGDVTIVAKAYDSAGRTGTSPPVTVTVSHPAPSVAMTGPAEGASVQGSAVTVTATAAPHPATESPVQYVQFLVDGSTEIGYDHEAPYEATWDTSGLAGAHTLTARAVDATGRGTTSPPRTVQVTNPLPAVALTSPAPFATVAGDVPLTATATPHEGSGAAIAEVTFEVDGWNVLGPDTEAPYEAVWNAAGAYGTHVVVAIARDANGQTARSAPVQLTVPSPAPTAALTSPVDGASPRSGALTMTVAASPDPVTGTPLSHAEFYVDGQYAGYDLTIDGGTFSAEWVATPGAHVITAAVYDQEWWVGNAAPVAVNVADPPGVPTGVTVTPGSDGTATVSWTAPEDDGGSPLTGYVVRTGTATQVATSSPYVFTGLTNGAPYTFSVAARNAAGDGPFSAATAAVVPGTRTSLTITTFSPSVLNHGSRISVKGTLKRLDTGGVLAGRSVQLLACAKGTTRCGVVATATTNTYGLVAMTYAPPQHKDMRLRFNQYGQYLSVTSAPRLVQVRAVVSSGINRTSMPLGYTVTVSGAVRPAHYGGVVWLQRYYNGAWRNVTYRRQSPTGAISYAVRPTARGTYTYRWYFPPDADHLGGYSAARSVKVY